MKRAHRHLGRGFTLIELLVAMSVFGVVLLVTTNMIVVNQRVATQQISQHQAREDAQMALLRIGELFSSAAYVYPRGRTLTLPGGNVTTGQKTLAFLVPWGTPYCNDGGVSESARYNPNSVHRNRYCLVLYRILRRSNFTNLLGGNPKASDWVLAEGIFKWVSWPVNTLPTRNFADAHATYSNEAVELGIVADSIARSATKVLMNRNSISRSSRKPIDPLLKTRSEIGNAADPYAMIDNVTFEVGVQFDGQPLVKETATLFARAVPRSAPPGTGN